MFKIYLLILYSTDVADTVGRMEFVCAIKSLMAFGNGTCGLYP